MDIFSARLEDIWPKKLILLPQVSYRHFTIQFIVPSPLEINKLREGGRDRQLSVVPIRILPYSNLRSVPTRYKYNGD